MSDLITLTTSDDPPVSLNAPRSTLIAHSAVFADLFSLPRPSTPASVDGSVPLAESAKELRPFLAVIGGVECVQLDEEGWESLARLADKYDSPTVRREIRARVWKLDAKHESPLHPFTLATFLEDKELLQRSALRAIAVQDRGSQRFGASEEWKKRLESWVNLREDHAFRVIKDAGPRVDLADERGRKYCDELARKRPSCAPQLYSKLCQAVVEEIKNVDVSSNEWDLVAAEGMLLGACADCRWRAKITLEEMRGLWRQAPSFPVD